MKRVIMVCTGNICRSPMAAGLLAHSLPEMLQPHVDVSSAGIHALQGYAAQDHAIETMAQIGIDISAHRANQLTHDLARSADLILAMDMTHMQFIMALPDLPQDTVHLILDFDPLSKNRQVADPYGGPLTVYQQCLETLKPAVAGVIESLS